MKVKDVIKNMQNYNPEDEVVILYWTKDIFDDEDNPITDEVWSKVITIIDNSTHLDFGSESIYNTILEELRDNEVNE
jgi:hypothetical protein